MTEQPETPPPGSEGLRETSKPAENEESKKEKLFNSPGADELYKLLLDNLPDKGDASVIGLPKGKMLVLDKDSGKPVGWDLDVKSGDLTFLVKPDHPVTNKQFVRLLKPHGVTSIEDHRVIPEYVIVRKEGEQYLLEIPEGDFFDRSAYFDNLFEGKAVRPPDGALNVRKAPVSPGERDLVKAVGRSILIAVNELPDWFVKRTKEIETFVRSTNETLSYFVDEKVLKPVMKMKRLDTKGPDPLVFSANQPEYLMEVIDLGVKPLSDVLEPDIIGLLSDLGTNLLSSDYYVTTQDERETKLISIDEGKARLEITFEGMLRKQTAQELSDVPVAHINIPYRLNSLRMYKVLPDGSESPLCIDFGINQDTRFSNRDEFLKFLADKDKIGALHVTHFIVRDSRKITQAPKQNS